MQVAVDAVATKHRNPTTILNQADLARQRGVLRVGVVHLAHRICETAQPGEVLVSSTVVDLVAGSGATFDDRGEHELKGIPATRRLFAVTT